MVVDVLFQSVSLLEYRRNGLAKDRRGALGDEARVTAAMQAAHIRPRTQLFSPHLCIAIVESP